MSVTIVQKNVRSAFVIRNGYIDCIECFKIDVRYLKVNLLKISIQGFLYLNETTQKNSIKIKLI